MEFKGIGTLSFDTPTEDLKPFFRKKYKTLFRSIRSADPNVITMKDVENYVAKGTRHITDPVEKEKATKRYIDLHVEILLVDGKSTTEEQFIDLFMSRSYCDKKSREKYMHLFMIQMKDLFEIVDYNRDGHIDFDEFSAFYNIYDFNTSTTARTVFDILDYDKDGFISANEFAYAKLCYLLCCGPEDPLKVFYGPLED